MDTAEGLAAILVAGALASGSAGTDSASIVRLWKEVRDGIKKT